MPLEAPSRGCVYLVGAGPGDPGLITMRGVECLRRADLVLYDYLANPRLLDHAPAGAERVCLGRHGGGGILSQAEINAWLVRAASAGQVVVRLKGGDPAVFGRASEEVAALDAAGIRYEIVPGITAALAVGSYAGFHLTDRGQASAVALVTGHESSQEEHSPLDYQALAAFPGTLLFYMGVTSAAEWSAALLAAGKPSATPVAIVRRATWPDQRSLNCTLATLADTIAAHHIRPPALIAVGEVVPDAAAGSWFTHRPLFGTRVLVTRAADPADELVERLEALGAGVLLQPALVLGPPADFQPLDQVLGRLAEFDWLVFSSAQGVRSYFDRLLSQSADLRALGPVKLAAIGPGTARALAQYYLRADVVPAEFRAEALASVLAPLAAGKRLLLIRASRGREVLADMLRAAGGLVTQVVAYSSQDTAAPAAEIAAELAAGRIDWITVTSSAIARSLVRLFGSDLAKSKLATISPLTSGVLRELGYPPAAEAKVYTLEGLVDAVRISRQSAVGTLREAGDWRLEDAGTRQFGNAP